MLGASRIANQRLGHAELEQQLRAPSSLGTLRERPPQVDRSALRRTPHLGGNGGRAQPLDHVDPPRWLRGQQVPRHGVIRKPVGCKQVGGTQVRPGALARRKLAIYSCSKDRMDERQRRTGLEDMSYDQHVEPLPRRVGIDVREPRCTWQIGLGAEHRNGTR